MNVEYEAEKDPSAIFMCRQRNHTGGTDILTANYGGHDSCADIVTITDITSFAFATRYIPPEREYRIHIGKTRQGNFYSICAQRKYQPDNLIATSYIIRSWAHGWRFYTIRNLNNIPPNVLLYSKRAIQALGLDFGAVDILTTDEKSDDGLRKAYILEVNTAPGLDERTAKRYADYFRKRLEYQEC